VATELGGTQITSLLETLPGIASVLRNPVADAFVGLIKAGARMGEFQIADAEEVLRYAVRRNLMAEEETERVLAEVKAAAEKRAERAAEREKARKSGASKVKPKAKAPSKAKAKTKPASRAKKAVKAAKKPAGRRRAK
jgi:septal ring-binding cell division protein DamX